MNPIRGLPLVSALLILAGMASAGIPGLVGFVAEFIVFQGSFSRFPVQTVLCIIAVMGTSTSNVIISDRFFNYNLGDRYSFGYSRCGQTKSQN